MTEQAGKTTGGERARKTLDEDAKPFRSGKLKSNGQARPATAKRKKEPPIARGFLLKLNDADDGIPELRGKPSGVYHEVEDREEHETSWRWLCSPLEIVARTRDISGKAHGRQLRIHTLDGTTHMWAMPMELMAGAGDDYRRELLYLGLTIAPGNRARTALHEYLSGRPERAVVCVDRVGWHGQAFALPEMVIALEGRDGLVLQSVVEIRHTIEGSLEGWQREVATPTIGNTRLVFGISTAFAAPLVHLIGEESGGFHLVGITSIGKTSVIDIAASVAGTGHQSWRLTDNAAEGLAVGSCDLLLALDEIGVARPDVVNALAYMFAAGMGKARMNRAGSLRSRPTWRTLVLSTGEIGLATKMNEAGLRARAGQHVRVVEIPADAGNGMGVIESKPDDIDTRTFVETLRQAALRHRGYALRAFLHRIMGDTEAIAKEAQAARQTFIDNNVPTGAAPEVGRVAGRFGLVAYAGELVARLKIVPWPEGEATAAAERMFKDWLGTRGGSGSAEMDAALKQVRLFLEQHGEARFTPAWQIEAEREVFHRDGKSYHAPRTVNRAGFRDYEGDGWTYFILPQVWREEVCKGFDANAVAREMIARGWMDKGEHEHLARKCSVPGEGDRRRYFTVTPAFMDSE
jgi:uncharacterized protein (DUF927 family)